MQSRSSLTRLLNAVNQLTKGLVAIMHKVTLLQSRITKLKEVNEKLSKR
jgi:hypothetical protein